jgi:hypothetical protein
MVAAIAPPSQGCSGMALKIRRSDLYEEAKKHLPFPEAR